ncbi:MAG: type II secretion system F family protein [Euryarchaeota archaeon]|nr:type II secretion system F family protein [Euryarchaeota archaeon]
MSRRFVALTAEPSTPGTKNFLRALWVRTCRYVQIIKLKYDIKREYFTVVIPVLAAIILVIAAALTGHVLTIWEESGTGTGSGKDSARLAAYQALVKEIGEVGDGGGGGKRGSTDAQEKTPGTKPDDDLDHIIVFAVLIAIIPYSIDTYRQKRLLKRREVAYSEFLFKLSELMRGGIDPIRGVIDLSTTDLGAITGNVRGAASAMVLGHSFSDAMNNMAKALGSKLITRYTALVVQAAYTGGAVADLILRTSEDMRSVIGIEREKDGNLKQYVVIFYLAQGIIVMLVYILSTSLLPLIQGVGMELLFGNSGVSEINFERGFFHMIMLNALFGGIIIGQIAEGEMKHGLKHSAILMIACYIACTALIFPSPQAGEMRIELVSGGGQEGFGGVPLMEQVVFNVTDLCGNPVPDIYIKIGISPDGSVNPRIAKTGSDGIVNVMVVPGADEGVYVIEAVAGDAVGRVNVRVLSGE